MKAQTAIEQAIDEGKVQGLKILGAVMFPNPKDHYLVKILSQKSDNEFVVHTFNTTDGGFHFGQYFFTWEDAITAFVDTTREILDRWCPR